MKRRKFMLLGSMLGLSAFLFASGESPIKNIVPEDVEETIQAVQEHLFPSESSIPSAKSMQTTKFLMQTIAHKSYDKDMRDFVIKGAKELLRREKQFVSLSPKEKEKVLRAYEETNYGSSWLLNIMTLTIEGMFCDPIYGSNINEEGWQALKSYGGFPRPIMRYIGI